MLTRFDGVAVTNSVWAQAMFLMLFHPQKALDNSAEFSPLIVAKLLTDLLRQMDPACGLAAITLPAPKPA